VFFLAFVRRLASEMASSARQCGCFRNVLLWVHDHYSGNKGYEDEEY